MRNRAGARRFEPSYPLRDETAAGYRELVERFGAESVADRLLAKWLADPEAESSWHRLAAAVKLAGEPDAYVDELLESSEREWRPAWERNRPQLGERGARWGD